MYVLMFCVLIVILLESFVWWFVIGDDQFLRYVQHADLGEQKLSVRVGRPSLGRGCHFPLEVGDLQGEPRQDWVQRLLVIHAGSSCDDGTMDGAAASPWQVFW